METAVLTAQLASAGIFFLILQLFPASNHLYNERRKQRCRHTRQVITVTQDLYDKVVVYIIENQNKFYRLAFSYVQNQEDALDAVQSAVCKALEHYGELKNRAAIKTWFYRIVVNESLSILRERGRTVLSGEGAQREEAYEEKGFEPPEEDLYLHINRLEEDVQEIIKLRFYEELSLQEISQIMEMNLSTVKSKLYRGLKALRVSVQEVDI